MNFKKLIALVLAAVMMMTVVSAFAATGDLSVNNKLTVSGLEEGDTAVYYKVLKWVGNDPDHDQSTYATDGGWAFADGFTSLTAADLDAILHTGITGEVAEHIAKAANSATPVATPAGVISEGTWTVNNPQPGLYMVNITATKSGYIYNPVFVSANYYKEGQDGQGVHNTWALVTDELSYSNDAMAKKTKINLDKKATANDGTTNLTAEGTYTLTPADTADTNEVLEFTVDSLIPHFAENYTDPKYIVTDILNGLQLTGPVTVYTVDDTDAETELASTNYSTVSGNTANATGYSISFTKAYLQGDTIPGKGQKIRIKYSAKVTDSAEFTVNQEDNTVTVKYSTYPSDETGHGLLKDKTNHFTFSLDAKVTGHGDKYSSEIVKIGVSDDGVTVIESEINSYYSQEDHGALNGAKFKIYTDAACQTPYTNKDITAETVFETEDGGLLHIKGLDAGNYWLKEISAPAGYVKLHDAIPVVITATIGEKEITETIEGVEVTYKTNYLKDYSVTVGGATTTYTIVNASEVVVSEAVRSADSSDYEAKNRKGLELPSTGGIGTTIFYVTGLLLTLGAAVIMISRRKASEE